MKKLDIKNLAITAAATGAGAVVAAKVSGMDFFTAKKADGSPKISGLLRGAILVAAGSLLPGFLGKGKNKGIAEGVGAGMTAVGAITLANNTVFKDKPVNISGIGELPVLGQVASDQFVTENYMESVNGLPTLGEASNLSM